MYKGKFIKTIIFIIILLAICVAGFTAYSRYTKNQSYSNLIQQANKYMDSGEYDKAISLFEQSLQYKKDSDIDKKLKLAKHLKQIKSTYNEGLNQMNNKKYLQAITLFNKITKEDDKFYADAQKKIEECTKLNNSFNNSINTNQNNNIQVEPKANETAASGKVTKEKAATIIQGYIKDKSPAVKFQYDHEQTKNGIKYYVIHVYDNMDSHTATRGWYYVEEDTGKAYEWDLVDDKLIPLN